MTVTAEELRNKITAKNEQIKLGVGADREHILRMDIIELEDELSKLGQTEVRELPKEEVTAEPILAMVDGLPLESYTETIDGAVLIRCEVEALVEAERRITKDVRASHAELLERHKKGLTFQNEIEVELAELLEKHGAFLAEHEVFLQLHKQELSQLALERDQALLYRDNAVKQLEEMAQELEQARIEVNQIREVKAYTEAERTAQAEEARQNIINSRVKIAKAVFEEGYPQLFKTSTRADNGEAVRFHYLEHGKFLEVSDDEYNAIRAMNAPIEAPELEVTEEEIFPETASAEESLSDVQQGTEQEDSGSEQPPVGTIETFEERTERRLNALELKVNRNDIIINHELEVA